MVAARIEHMFASGGRPVEPALLTPRRPGLAGPWAEPGPRYRSSGSTARPAGVIRPSASSRRTFSRLVADQFDPGRRATNRIAYRSPSIPLVWVSTHP